ncbi:hypothetical protein C1Y63_00765 [Corynebacterium sp. 13CS0277]|nr:hypothetical protein C1Y63_00765 [Corynebacterium sp. 13CS0277]
MGDALGTGGHLIALRRVTVGPYTMDHARTLEDLENNPTLSLSLDEALTTGFPTLTVTAAEAASLAQGQWLPARGVRGVHAAIGPDGRAVALVKESGRRLATTFVARPSTL